MKKLRVEQEMVVAVIDTNNVWERFPFSVVAYSYDGQTEAFRVSEEVPDGYAPGLLVCYVDDERVAPHVFDGAVRENGLTTTRDDIRRSARHSR